MKTSSYLQFKVYRKATHANSYLHYFSFHSSNVKLNVAQGLFFRALRICSPRFRSEEFNFIFHSLFKLGYPDFVLRKALSKAKSSFFKSRTIDKPNSASLKFTSVPFLPSLDSPSNHQLAKFHKSKLVFRYPNSIKSSLINNSPNDIQSGVYRVSCKDCNKKYIGETGRTFTDRMKEHQRAIRNLDTNNAIAAHCHDLNHSLDLKNFEVLAKCPDHRLRRVIESAFIKTNSPACLNFNSGFCSFDLITASRVINSLR